jgi:hypothetical protein
MSKNKKPKVVDFSNTKIGFIGTGKMTESIIQGLITYGKVVVSRLHVNAPSTKNLERLQQRFSDIHVSKRNIDIFGKYDCDIVFFAVHVSVIKNCYKLSGQRSVPLTTNFIPNMKHPLYVLPLVVYIWPLWTARLYEYSPLKFTKKQNFHQIK